MRLPVLARPTGRSVRKIGLLGSHTASLATCPWDDPTWELWGHASSRAWYRRELDRYFDIHPRACWVKNGKNQSRYTEWLRTTTVPVYMQEKHPDVPASVAYPKDRILLEFGGLRHYFKNTMAWMTALAMAEGVTHLGLWGINYGHDTEYETQRGSAEYWIGRAEERGIQVFLPTECTLLAEPAGLYGWESHDENGKRLPQWGERERKSHQTIRPIKPGEVVKLADPPKHLMAQIEEDEALRPDWARWDIADKANGGLKESNV